PAVTVASPCPASLSLTRPPRDRPSFPTRRSSDLNGVLDSGRSPDLWISVVLSLPMPYVHSGLYSLHSNNSGGTVLDLHLTSLLRDRKSTRLNSSHVSISYAVFRLKKHNRRKDGRV